MSSTACAGTAVVNATDLRVVREAGRCKARKIFFGVAMNEFSGRILSMGDRYLIQNILGADSVGVYSAAYNLCDYIRSILLGSLVAAAQPM